MRSFLTLAFTFLMCGTAFSAEQYSNICYFSLNNEKEFEVMKDITDRANEISPRKIHVEEFLNTNQNPEEAFKKMIESGKSCDGLVISGHHTGSFGGKRADGSLSIGFIEKLKCNPKYSKWFENIKALWLQGCRTLGVNIEMADPTSHELDADRQAQRVGNELEVDSLEQGMVDLAIEFTATLDQENPLSSRYLRAFPRASVFGWTKTAPGERSRSELSIPYHLAHMMRLMDDREEYFVSPTDKSLNNQQILKYVDVINSLLHEDIIYNNKCREFDPSQLAVEAWFSHGQKAIHHLPYSFDNHDLLALAPLYSSDSDLLKKSRELECLLKQRNLPKDELLEIVDTILSDKTLFGYNFNALYELLLSSKYSDDKELNRELKEKFKSSPIFHEFIKRKLDSKLAGLVRKIEYHYLYTEVTEEEYKEQKEKIILETKEQLNLKPTDQNYYDLLDYKYVLLSALIDHNIIQEEEMDDFIELENLPLFFKVYLVSEKAKKEGKEFVLPESIHKRILKESRRVPTPRVVDGELAPTRNLQQAYNDWSALLENLNPIDSKLIAKYQEKGANPIFLFLMLKKFSKKSSIDDFIKAIDLVNSETDPKLKKYFLNEVYSGIGDIKDADGKEMIKLLEYLETLDEEIDWYHVSDLLISAEFTNFHEISKYLVKKYLSRPKEKYSYDRMDRLVAKIQIEYAANKLSKEEASELLSLAISSDDRICSYSCMSQFIFYTDGSLGIEAELIAKYRSGMKEGYEKEELIKNIFDSRKSKNLMRQYVDLKTKDKTSPIEKALISEMLEKGFNTPSDQAYYKRALKSDCGWAFCRQLILQKINNQEIQITPSELEEHYVSMVEEFKEDSYLLSALYSNLKDSKIPEKSKQKLIVKGLAHMKAMGASPYEIQKLESMQDTPVHETLWNAISKWF